MATEGCNKVRVTVKGYTIIEACKGENLGRILAKHGVMPLPCGGRGLCGLCKVRVSGGASPPTGNEALRGFTGEVRLACQVRVTGDVEVEPLLRATQRLRVPTTSLEVTVTSNNPLVRPVEGSPVEVLKPVITGGEYSPRLLLVAGEYMTTTRGSPEKTLLVDIGTTKIAYQVLDREGAVVVEGVIANPLNVYGADVVSRMTVFNEDPKLYVKAVKTLREALADIAEKHDTRLILAAGNSVNTHILAGLPLDTLAVKPFQPLARGPFILYARGYPIVTAPLIAGFVGGDAYSVLVASLALDPPRPYLIIDIGTNTETLLVTRDRIYVTSTPAGPAFEGHLASSSTIYHGGIYRVNIEGLDGSGRPVFTYDSIGEPRGFLGTGVISIMAELLRKGLIDETGRIVRGYTRLHGVKAFVVDERRGIVFTQKDIREFQKAYSAVRTSWHIVLREAGLSPSELRVVFIAGTFGSSIDRQDLIDLGLVPVCSEEKIVYGGNMVLSGLRVMALDSRYYTMYKSLVKQVVHINLAEHPDYTSEWVENLKLLSPCSRE
jgi:uncharacterized 2Fe-2S/4Fe-4S cluster protein (DUF4445 family)